MSAHRYLGFINQHADQPVANPTLHHYLNLDLVKQYVEFLRQRLCIPATLGEQVEVAIKVVTWLWRDHQLQQTEGLDGQMGGLLQLLESLKCQIHHNLPRPRPRKQPKELVTAEHLTLMLITEYDSVSKYVSDPKALAAMTIAQCVRLMQLCLATCFWAFIQPVRPAGGFIHCTWHTTPCPAHEL